ncbi:MAG: hypothetical protein KDJ31_18305, partial [Candidatus Competibacteraceae bacterium]|nr:hypothetical protein [Candidatus Competibacteraceae bacterium]
RDCAQTPVSGAANNKAAVRVACSFIVNSSVGDQVSVWESLDDSLLTLPALVHGGLTRISHFHHEAE